MNLNYEQGKKFNIRNAYGDALLDLGGRYDKLVVLDADLGESLRTGKFARTYPDRYFQMSVSEADMQCSAAGFALEGFKPITNTFAVFIPRGIEQIRQSIAFPNLDVKIVGSHGGIVTGEDGVSHQAIEDIGMMRSIPNMIIVCPSDAVQTYRATEAMVEYEGPVYLRLMRPDVPVIYPNYFDFKINLKRGNGYKLREYGKDVAILSTGYMTHLALEASDKLNEEGIKTEVIDILTLKPLPKDIILRAADETKGIVTAEDHNIIGGLGSAVDQLLLSENCPTERRYIGIKDTFAESGKPEELLEKYSMDVRSICDRVKDIL
ncbi:MAG: transketolase C-terminal domain-containing protein [Candidatus Aenigmarchaeota archaeon]|nr:transketolase C-terminal domain-containing protein [Candidatus Aenigmarchaeota archaeon]